MFAIGVSHGTQQINYIVREIVHRLNQDASELRQARDDVLGALIKLA